MRSRITGVHVYPVKGCRGISLQQARICPTGLNFDRHWVIIADRNAKFESQRKDPKMALIDTALPDEAFLQDIAAATGHLTLTAPGVGSFQVPLQNEQRQKRKACSVWAWEGEGLDEGDEVAEYLSDYMGHKVRLVRYTGEAGKGTTESEITRRQTDPDYTPENTDMAFSDAMPYMIANEASLTELNSRLSDAVPMNRFRPNFTVSGHEPWQEDTWEKIKIGDVHFVVNTPNGRCKVTTINQETAEVSKATEPLRTLGKYRSGKILGWDAERSWKGLVFFGWYMLAMQGGVIKVGDEMEVLSRRNGSPQKLDVYNPFETAATAA